MIWRSGVHSAVTHVHSSRPRLLYSLQHRYSFPVLSKLQVHLILAQVRQNGFIPSARFIRSPSGHTKAAQPKMLSNLAGLGKPSISPIQRTRRICRGASERGALVLSSNRCALRVPLGLTSVRPPSSILRHWKQDIMPDIAKGGQHCLHVALSLSPSLSLSLSPFTQ